MAIDLEQIPSSCTRLLFDYSAVFQLSSCNQFGEFTEWLIQSKKEVILNSSFRYFHECVSHESTFPEKRAVSVIRDFVERLRFAGLLKESVQTSIVTFVKENASDRSACLFLAKKSISIERVRDSDLSGNFSVCIVSLNQIDLYPDLDTCMNSELAYTINPLSQSTDYLDVDVYCNVGDKVYSEDGSVIVLVDKISTGAEGIVFRTTDPKWVAKIYHKGVITPLRWRKLIHMTKTGISAKGICWPSVLLYSFNNGPVGYLMQTAEGNTLGTIFDGPDAILDHFPEWQRIDVLQTAAHIIEKVAYLQLHGVLIGDIQLKNMMMKDSENVFLIDMDSVQVEDMPCPVGTEDYTPPELWDFSFSEILRRPFHEDYSCGILVFSILFCGQHPYAQRLGKETLREEILANSFPYLTNSSAESMIPVGGYDKIWVALTENLKIMFIEAFSRGKRFEPIEWYSAITEYRDLLLRRDSKDEQSYLLFPHTDLSTAKERPVSSGYKKTIREAIIQAPLHSNRVDTTESSSANKMLYNRQNGNAATEERFFEPVKVPEAKVSTPNREGIGNPINRSTESQDVKHRKANHKSESLFRRMIHKLRKDRSLILFILFLICAAGLVLLGLFLD
jgi:hypothetical protein